MNLSGFATTITTERCSLRTLEPQDISPSYVRWLNDPKVNRFLESRFEEQTIETVKSFIEFNFLAEDSVLFGIFLKLDDSHVGNIKLSHVSPQHLTGEIGFVIGESDFWGQGLATEAIVALSDWCFSELKLFKLTAGCYSENQGSQRALEKSGFSVEAVLVAQVIDSFGERQDAVRLARMAKR